MFQQFYKPHPALQPFVKEYHLLHLDFVNLPKTAAKPYPPRGEQCLYFYPRNTLSKVEKGTGIIDSSAHSILAGQPLTRVNMSIPRDYIMLKVAFNPSGLFRFLGIPLTHFTDSGIETEAVLGNEIKQVNEQLKNTEGYQNMIAVVENFLLERIKKVKFDISHIDQVCFKIQNPNNNFSLDALARQAYLSPRQFERKFVERIGVSPKLYARIIRFQNAFKIKDKNPDLNWLQIAVNNGYTDYNHLVKDFKQFTGVTPTILMSEHEGFEKLAEQCRFFTT